MKIAMVTQSMLVGYGISEVADLLSKEMVKLGHAVTLITGQTELSPNEYDLIPLRPFRLPLVGAYWQSNFLTDVRLTPIIRLLKDSDVVITFDPMHVIGALAKLVYERPVMMYYFGIPPPNVLSSFTRRAEAMRQRLFWHSSFQFADYILTNSKYTWTLLPKNLQRKAIVTYHGADHLTPRSLGTERDRIGEKLGLHHKKILLSIGRFATPYKGMNTMVNIFNGIKSRRRDVALLLVGRNSGTAFSGSSSIRALTNVSTELLAECLASCDVYCSASSWEGFNIPLVAAQANGKPAVAFNVGAHSEVLINGETGFLAETIEEFRERLEVLVDDDKLRRQMGEKALHHAGAYTWESCGRRLSSLLEKGVRNVYSNREGRAAHS